jgi:hypothetical protein
MAVVKFQIMALRIGMPYARRNQINVSCPAGRFSSGGALDSLSTDKDSHFKDLVVMRVHIILLGHVIHVKKLFGNPEKLRGFARNRWQNRRDALHEKIVNVKKCEVSSAVLGNTFFEGSLIFRQL